MALGLVVGLAAYLVDVHLIAPAVMNRAYGTDLWAENIPRFAAWLGHIVFGLCFATYNRVFRPMWLRMSGHGDLLAEDARLT